MIFFTQLIYIRNGQEDIFSQFEAIAIPLISKHNGRLLLRVRPDDASYIACNMEKPYEIHFGGFNSEDDLDNFLKDEERQKFIHLKRRSIKSSLIIYGKQL